MDPNESRVKAAEEAAATDSNDSLDKSDGKDAGSSEKQKYLPARSFLQMSGPATEKTLQMFFQNRIDKLTEGEKKWVGGCNDQEIYEMEREVKDIIPEADKFPLPYRTFLKFFGKGAANIFSDMDICPGKPKPLWPGARSIPEFHSIEEGISTLCQDRRDANLIPKTAFVFAGWNGDWNFYMNLDGKKSDPAVYTYDVHDLSPNQQPKKVSETLSDFLTKDVFELG